MKPKITFLYWVIFSCCVISCNQQRELFITLDGKFLSKDDAKMTLATPYLQIVNSESPNGVVMFYSDNKTESASIPAIFNQLGFSVATLNGNNIALDDAIKAFRLIKSESKLKLNTDYTCIMGYSYGGKFAALTAYALEEEERPDDLILINPTNFEKTAPNTVFPVINPPLSTQTRLLCITDTLNLNQSSITATSEYVKTWIGYDGTAFFKEIANVENLAPDNGELVKVLTSFYTGDFIFPKENENPAAVPVEGHSSDRHAEKLKLVKGHKYDLLFVGNSITNNWEKPEYQFIWKKYFGSRNAINLGFSGYRTENIIWNIQNGELKDQSPKVIILEIGTNNIDEKNYPTRHTARQLAGGIEEIVKIFREKCPDSKIILLGSFPGCYDGPNPTSHRRILERASDIVSQLADNEQIFYCDVNHVFLNRNGSIKQELMPDWLHPNPKGAELWAQAMEPLLSELMEDESRLENILQIRR